MITQLPIKCQTSSSHNTYSLGVSDVYDTIAGRLMWDNDKRNIPIPKIGAVASALMAYTVMSIADHTNFEYRRLPSDRHGYTPLYVFNKPKDSMDFVFAENYSEYDTRVLRDYYTADALEVIVDDIRYLILSELYRMTPNTYFSHKVTISLPHVRCLFVTIHNEDMVECDEDIIHDGADGGLHLPEGLSSIYGD
ncbi:hypothetical protein [Vibrio phage VP4B]|uniref:Uncharacterized protein n=1 Tax=Vibrio phage VP4B TaxID=1262540 RepID=V9M0L0_9CAUD|nr:hypothetical protein FDJ61_gp069 [Vibrio phage VP4B]AGB07183.1 hypothetical protein [Vibrio phage VP4B]